MYLFCLAYRAKHNYFWDSSMLMQVPTSHFLLLLSSVLLYGYDRLLIDLFVNIWVVSYLGLFQMKVSGIFKYKILFLYTLSFLLNKYLVMECLDHMACMFPFFKKPSNSFPARMVVPFHIPTSSTWVCQFLPPCQHLEWSVFFILAILTNV